MTSYSSYPSSSCLRSGPTWQRVPSTRITSWKVWRPPPRMRPFSQGEWRSHSIRWSPFATKTLALCMFKDLVVGVLESGSIIVILANADGGFCMGAMRRKTPTFTFSISRAVSLVSAHLTWFWSDHHSPCHSTLSDLCSFLEGTVVEVAWTHTHRGFFPAFHLPGMSQTVTPFLALTVPRRTSIKKDLWNTASYPIAQIPNLW